MLPTQINNIYLVAPIIFITLLVIFPLIGCFAGWKRAVYWGGGNFLFYIIGLLVWKFAGVKIAQLFTPILEKALSSMQGVSASEILASAKSLLAPVFFIVVLLIGNLLLLINYYAWYKKVVGLKKTKAEREALKELKQAQKLAAKTGKKIPVKFNAVVERNKLDKVYNKKPFNIVMGMVSMELLMVPTTITLTQAAFYATTTSTTRANAPFAAKIYDSLQKTANATSWMSYYNGSETATDWNGTYGLLDLATSEYTITDENGNTKNVSGVQAVTEVFQSGVSGIIENTANVDMTKDTGVKALVESVNHLSENFNSLVAQANGSLEAMFQSNAITNIASSIVTSIAGTSTAKEITDELYNGSFVQTFETLKEQYQAGEITLPESHETITITKINQIPTSQESFDNLKGMVSKFVNTDGLSETNKADFDNKVKDLLSMIFAVA